MFTLSGTVGYAINAAAYLAKTPTQSMMIGDIAEGSGVPRAYLAKVVRRLNDAGILSSKRGYRGGIWLARSPKEISLLEIVHAMEGEDYFTGCFLGAETCSDDRDCPAHVFWKQMREQIAGYLSDIMLADVAKFQSTKVAKQLQSSGLKIPTKRVQKRGAP